MRDPGRNKHEVDFNERPFIAIWEATQACDLGRVHYRASAQPTEAQHYHRYVLQMRTAARRNRESPNDSPASPTPGTPNEFAMKKDTDGIGRAPPGFEQRQG